MNKNLIFIVVALILGAIASFIAIRYVESVVESRIPLVQSETMEVVVPNRDLSPGEYLDSSVLALRPVPVEFIPAGALTAGDYEVHLGRILRTGAKAGAPLDVGTLISSAEQVSRVIQPGKVAYTLQVDDNNSISGMIVPGDHVDILMTTDETGSSRVMPLLENVVVLATGTQLGERYFGEDVQPFGNVTLELAPVDAERLTIAQRAGSLRVLLRQMDDSTAFGLEGLSQAELFRRNRGPVARGVEFIIGGGR